MGHAEVAAEGLFFVPSAVNAILLKLQAGRSGGVNLRFSVTKNYYLENSKWTVF